MTIEDKKENNEVEIDSDLYECLALLGMELGEDNVTDFINDMIYYGIRMGQGEKEEKERKNTYDNSSRT